MECIGLNIILFFAFSSSLVNACSSEDNINFHIKVLSFWQQKFWFLIKLKMNKIMGEPQEEKLEKFDQKMI